MINQSNYTIKQADQSALEMMVHWAAQEGWNPGLSDVDCFFNTYQSGFFVGYLNDEPISCISAVSYGEAYSFIGFYIVKPEYRGKGYGIQIWNKAMEHLSAVQNIGLDGVVAQQENYKKSGFILAYRNIRFEYIKASDSHQYHNEQIKIIQQEDFPTIYDYDQKIFGHSRKSFLKPWLVQSNGLALSFQKNHEIKGYGVIRKCEIGYKIGPLFCEDRHIAEELFLSLLNAVEKGGKIYLDVPEINASALQLATKYDMQKSFETARMYTNPNVEYPIHKVFGVSTFELG